MSYKSDTVPVPRPITQAVVELAKVCAFYKMPLDIDDALQATVLEQARTIAQQREIIRKLEERLGIDDEL